MKKRTKCYIYTRVSTAVQVDGYSLDAQREKLRKYAEYEDMTIAGEYSDEGFSGKNIQGRLEFQRMLTDIQEGKDDVSYVLVFKLSRFGRNAADVLNSLQLMQDFGVNLICVEDGIDSSKDSGKLMISVLSAVAEIERENIRTQTMAGREQKAREGKWNGGFAPYGYRLEKGELLIAEDEAEIIRVIYDRYIHTSDGLAAVANYLNNHGYTKKVRQNGTIPGFSSNFVKDVLDNPVYMGKIAYGRRRTEKKIGSRNEMHVVEQDEFPIYEGKHEAIISEEDWKLAQEKRKLNAFKREKIHDPKHAHILSGILKCPCCGKSLYGNIAKAHSKDKKTRFYYYCKNTVGATGHKCTFRLNIEQTEMNRMVAAIVSAMVNDPQFSKAIKEKIGSAVDTKDLEKQLSILQAQLRQTLGIKTRLERQMDTLDITDEHFDRKMLDLQRRYDEQYDTMEQIETQIDDVKAQILSIQQEKISGDNIYQLLLAFDEVYGSATEAEQKEFMQAFIERIDLYPEKQKDGNWIRNIVFAFPVPVNGQEVKELSLENETTVDTIAMTITGTNTGDVTLTKGSSSNTITLEKNGDTFTIGGKNYTAPCNGAVYTIDANGSAILTFKIDNLSDGGYALRSGDIVMVGNYIYTAPSGDGAKTGDVTIKQGTGNNPTVVLKNANGTVDVALASDSNTKTTYTAVNANTTFAMSDDANASKIDLLSNSDTSTNSKIEVAHGVTVDVEGKKVVSAANNTVIGLGSSSGFVLESGKASITGEVTVNAKLSDEKTVAVTVPANVTATIDLDSLPPAVKNLGNGNSVTYGGVTYTAVTDSAFPLNGSQLTNAGEKAVVSKGTSAEITLGSGTALVMNVLNMNTGTTTITKGDLSTTVVLENQGDKFTVGAQTYTAGSGDTEFTIDGDGNVTMTGGTVTLNDDESITGGSGKLIENPANTGNDQIVVKVSKTEGIDTVTVPKNGKVTIGGVEYENASAETEMKIEATKDSGNKLTSGSVKLGTNGAINVGTVSVTSTSTGEETITVNIGTSEDENSVVVPKGGKVKIANTEYEAVSEASFAIDANGNVTLTGGSVKLASNGKVKIGETEYVAGTDGATIALSNDVVSLTAGSIKLDKNGKINVSVSGTDTAVQNITVTDTGNEQIEVSADGKVIVPNGGETTIGTSTITDVKVEEKDAIFTIDSRGKVDVDLGVNDTVTINGVKYTGLKPTNTTVVVKEETASRISSDVSASETDKEAIQNVISKAKVEGVTEAVSKKMDTLITNSGIDTTNVNINKIDVDIDVEVKLTAAELSGETQTMKYTATPVATVTTKKANGETVGTPATVDVPNSLLSGTPITVRLPLPAGFVPEQIKHISSSDNSVEYFLRTSARGAKTFTIEDDCAVFKITKFSEFELSGTVTYVEPTSSSGGSSGSAIRVESTENGSIAVSSSKASKGKLVTITAKPDSGYVLGNLTVTDGNKNKVELTKKSEGEYTFVMPAGAVTVEGSFVKAGTWSDCGKDEGCSIHQFTDAQPDAWYHDGVHYCLDNGLMVGTSDSTFSPNSDITRGQIVTILWRLEGSSDASVGSFGDVASDAYYAKAVAWANANGIVSGYGNGMFGPNDSITREQFAAILYRYAQFKGEDVSIGEDTNILDYNDAQSISSYAVSAFQWACGSGVITGTSDTMLSPDGRATRAQAACMMQRFLTENK